MNGNALNPDRYSGTIGVMIYLHVESISSVPIARYRKENSYRKKIHILRLALCKTLKIGKTYGKSLQKGIYFSVLLINEQLIATNSPNRIHGNAAPIKSTTIFFLLSNPDCDLMIFKGNISCYILLLKSPLTLENTKFIAGELSLIVSLVLYLPIRHYEP